MTRTLAEDIGVARSTVDLSAMSEIQRRVLWLSVRMVDFANHERAAGEVKVGGHQASSASMVGIMTALWFGHLEAEDRVAVKPHASPVLHAINYLVGHLDRSYLTRLREFGGLQAYPSRTKDPDVQDFSTGSVGLGVAAPLFAAAARRYVDLHFSARTRRPPRFVTLAGDAELDEGNVWEAIADPAVQELGNVLWVVDTNRQSLDRVVPEQKIKKHEAFFRAAGWHVVEAKYGWQLEAAFQRDGGDELRAHIDNMGNEHYQSLFALGGPQLREQFLLGASQGLRRFVDDYDDNAMRNLSQDLGGHDLVTLLDCYRQCDETPDRPSVVFAYTVKGWGLPVAGDPLNHAALLSSDQIAQLRASLGVDLESEWERFDPTTPAGRLCADVGQRLQRPEPCPALAPVLPTSALGRVGAKPISTQEAFGRVLVRLADDPEVRSRLVTMSPDVSVSTNLGGWINKVGVFHHRDEPDFLGDGRLLRWKQSPAGQHVELGISEMNLFLMLHAFGLSADLHGEHLLPIGTVYDPFVCRGLDALIYALYNGARFVMVGTPAGVTLAPEGGAHQSAITASIGLELPQLTYAEPCFATTLDFLLCDGLQQLSSPNGSSLYLRLSTRPVDQTPWNDVLGRSDPDQLRADVIAGCYRLREPSGRAPEVVLAAIGPVVPEALAAAEILDAEGVPALVLDVVSADRVYRDWRGSLQRATRGARPAGPTFHLAEVIRPHERCLPIVTIHDAASHSMAWLGSVFGTRSLPVGVDSFGQSGTITDLYGQFDLLPEQIVNAALVITG